MAGGLTSPDIVDATAAYEEWLAVQTPVIAADLATKHELMASGVFPFLRGTAYRWAQRWPAVCAELTDAPVVVAVGDLHVENFGTWRDVEGRLVWGINDIDEATPLPYASDLVRLATSAALASATSHLTLPAAAAAEAILDGYTTGLEAGGRPFVLAERHHGLREVATAALNDPARYWAKLQALAEHDDVDPAGIAAAARQALPDGATAVRVAHRVADVGSLGRGRVVAVAQLAGSAVAREAKPVVPSAWSWAGEHLGERRPSPPVPDDTARAAHAALLARVMASAVRSPDPAWTVSDRWLVRRLAPDCSRIELANLPRVPQTKLLHAMGAETANLHLATPTAVPAVLSDIARRGRTWLAEAASAMAADVARDQQEWAAGPPSHA